VEVEETVPAEAPVEVSAEVPKVAPAIEVTESIQEEQVIGQDVSHSPPHDPDSGDGIVP
jgi:hypothetical protein